MKITKRMIQKLAKEYPGKKIICLPEKNPQEVICEIASAPDGSWSLAVALIIKSVPHYHEKTWEVYHVLRGAVRVFDSANNSVLTQWKKVLRDTHWTSKGPKTVWPLTVHCASAIGRYPAKVLVMATPAWSSQDHHFQQK